jgi:hypothetical protein
MVRRHLHLPYRFVCITDQSEELRGFDGVEIVRLWQEGGRVGCWVRLKSFSEEMKDLLGPRFLSLDLDLVIVDDITPMVDRPEPFVIAKGATALKKFRNNLYSGTMYLLTSGYHKVVWESFRDRSPKLRALWSIVKECRRNGLNGTDSAWIARILGPGQPTWEQEDGLHSFCWDVEAQGGCLTYPKGAKIILFHGQRYDPADSRLYAEYPWVKEHWR